LPLKKLVLSYDFQLLVFLLKKETPKPAATAVWASAACPLLCLCAEYRALWRDATWPELTSKEALQVSTSTSYNQLVTSCSHL